MYSSRNQGSSGLTCDSSFFFDDLCSQGEFQWTCFYGDVVLVIKKYLCLKDVYNETIKSYDQKLLEVIEQRYS